MDLAGNALDGEFNGTFPTRATAWRGGNFQGQFVNGGNAPRLAVPSPVFVPVVAGSRPPVPRRPGRGPLGQEAEVTEAPTESRSVFSPIRGGGT